MLLDLIQNDAIQLSREAITNGGEYAGPCPFCQDGKDRFRVWPEKDKFWCRQCNKSGDSIQYLRDLHGMSFKQAAEATGKVIPLKYQPKAKPITPDWEPSASVFPCEAWRKRAGRVLRRSQQLLWSDDGEAVRERLAIARCLGEDAIQRHGLGWIPLEVFDSKAAWGLDSGKLALPAGVVIPCWRDDKLVRLRIRQSKPDAKPKYWTVAGSVGVPLIIDNGRDTVIILESDLDAILIDQEVGNLTSVIALGSCSGKPDIEAHELITRSKRVLLSPDYDDAGKQSAKWWFGNYKDFKIWAVPDGNDVGDYALMGGDINEWIRLGIKKH